MTREEAINRLNRIAEKAVHTPGETPFVMSIDDGIAVHMAISALRCSSDDLISREMALAEAYPIVIDGEVFNVVQVETLEGLPPAQPIRCGECKHWNEDGMCRISKEYISNDDYFCKYAKRKEG